MFKMGKVGRVVGIPPYLGSNTTLSTILIYTYLLRSEKQIHQTNNKSRQKVYLMVKMGKVGKVVGIPPYWCSNTTSTTIPIPTYAPGQKKKFTSLMSSQGSRYTQRSKQVKWVGQQVYHHTGVVLLPLPLQSPQITSQKIF